MGALRLYGRRGNANFYIGTTGTVRGTGSGTRRRLACTAFAVAALLAVSAVGPAGAESARAQTAAAGVAARAASGPLAFAARLAADDTRARLVVEFESEPDFEIRYLAAPDRIIIEFPRVTFGFEPGSLTPRGLVTSIRYGDSGPGRSRLILGLAGPARLDLAEVEPIEGGGGHRLVLDAVASDRATFDALVAGTDWNSIEGTASGEGEAERPYTIMLDAGHGGIDGGAEGVHGTQEKDVTLAFTKALAEALSEFDDVKVELTRSDDRFISLSGRLRAAHEAKADLFLSLHADSIRIRRLRGATVYTLSDRASDAVAEALAAQEGHNEAVVGAVFEEAPESVAGILIDMARNETRVLSTSLAEQIVAEFEGEVRLINNPHRQAGFRVLQSPDLPSALVELGYLSNPEDEKLLNDPEWREKAAGLLAASIDRYRDEILAAAR